MQEQVNEKISLLIDDELQSNKALYLLQIMRKDEELKQCLQRYQLISQVLKHDSCAILDRNFTEKIHQQISYEPAILIPRKKAGVNRQKIGMALAASIVLAIVWVMHTIDQRSYMGGYTPVYVSVVPMNPRFNDYLMAHDFSNNVPRSQPYARVVDFQRQ